MDLVAAVIFDLDGTLLDSDEALADAFVACGVDRRSVTRGHVVADECERLGIDLDDYLGNYDELRAVPFEGVAELLDGLESLGISYSICSNKHPRSGLAELRRLDWSPKVAMFADTFDGPKALGPVLDALDLDPECVLFVGDTSHDLRCSMDAGCSFAWAAWNPLCEPVGDAPALRSPMEILALIRST